jgi:V/A-type H+-transporting ATPase subunit K
MKIILFTALLVVFATVATGYYLMKKEVNTDGKKLKEVIRYNLLAFIPLMLFAIGLVVPEMVFAADGTTAASPNGLGLIAVALSTGLATIGAGYAVGAVGSSALGAVSEDPKILGKTLIFVGLAEGIAIYGLIISIMILGRL